MLYVKQLIHLSQPSLVKSADELARVHNSISQKQFNQASKPVSPPISPPLSPPHTGQPQFKGVHHVLWIMKRPRGYILRARMREGKKEMKRIEVEREGRRQSGWPWDGRRWGESDSSVQVSESCISHNQPRSILFLG